MEFHGTPAHRSRHTVAYLNANVPELIEPENWPPNSPDLNPVDYSIWGCLQQLVYREPIRDVEHLKEVILCCLAEITEALVDSASGRLVLMQSLKHVVDILSICLTGAKFTQDINC